MKAAAQQQVQADVSEKISTSKIDKEAKNGSAKLDARLRN